MVQVRSSETDKSDSNIHQVSGPTAPPTKHHDSWKHGTVQLSAATKHFLPGFSCWSPKEGMWCTGMGTLPTGRVPLEQPSLTASRCQGDNVPQPHHHHQDVRSSICHSAIVPEQKPHTWGVCVDFVVSSQGRIRHRCALTSSLPASGKLAATAAGILQKHGMKKQTS